MMSRFAHAIVPLLILGCGGAPPLSKGGQAGAAGGTSAVGSAGTTPVAGVAGADAAAGATGGAGAAAGAGGADATSGAGTAGSAGMAGAAGIVGSAGAAGIVGSAGAAGPIGTGCGKPLPANQVPTVPGRPTGYTHFTVMGTGATLAADERAKAGPRTFWVRVPADYDPNHRYRVVYIGQGCGGYQVANTSTIQFFQEAQGGTEEAIYVALDIPQDMANQDCYDNNSGLSSQEYEAFQLFHTVVDSTYCVDNENVFIAGYSTGGFLANQWGCYFAGDVPTRKFAPQYHIRGQAAVSGAEPANLPACGGPVAAIWIHDLMDGNPYAQSHDVSLPRVLKMNGCFSTTPNTAPWHEDIMGKGVCVQYTDCPAAFPVVFCTTAGQGHADQHVIAIPGFTAFFGQATAP
jgi:poly(3-hydroxybutyrate) depolymerase